MKKCIYLLFLILVFCFYGCGKSRGLSSASSGASLKYGSLKVNFIWPGGKKYIPDNTQTIYLRIYGDSLSEEITKTYERPSSGQTSDTISGIKVGTVNIEVSALDSAGNILAYRDVPTVIKEGENNTLSITLGVTIKDDGFTPSTIYIPVNTTLMWVNNGNNTHALIGNSPFDGADISPGTFKSYTFSSKGTFNYTDYYNTSLSGSVVVYEVLAPIIYSIYTSSGTSEGRVGDKVTINGSGFGPAHISTSNVTFNEVAVTQFDSWSNTEITCYVPQGATSGNVIVIVGNQSSNSWPFTVTGVTLGWSPVQSGKDYHLKGLNFHRKSDGKYYGVAVGFKPPVPQPSPTPDIPQKGKVLEYNGSSWSENINASGGDYEYHDVKIVNENDIYIVGKRINPEPAETGAIIRNWKGSYWGNNIFVGEGTRLFGIDIFPKYENNLSACAVGNDDNNNSIIGYNSNLGKDPWNPSNLGNVNLYGVASCGNFTEKVFAVGNNGIYISFNIGQTWSLAYQTGSNLRGIFFCDANNGWIVGSNGMVYYTKNGGGTEGKDWNITCVPESSLFNLNAVYFVDKDNGWIVGRDIQNNGVIFSSTNGGATWTREELSFIISELNDVYFINMSSGFAVGEFGAIIKYSPK